MCRCRLALIRWGKNGEAANANSSNRPSNDNLIPGVLRRDLDDHATDEDDAPDHDGYLSPNPVSHWRGGQSTE